MSESVNEIRLQNGTMVRHKLAGYVGRIDGTTAIRACFTARGELLSKSSPGQTFQYRVAVTGESMRRIAPAEDLEVVEIVSNQRQRVSRKSTAQKKDTGIAFQ